MGGLVAIEWVKQQRNPRITGIILSSPCLGLQIKVNKALDLASKGLNVIAPSLKVDSGLSIDMATRNEDVIGLTKMIRYTSGKFLSDGTESFKDN